MGRRWSLLIVFLMIALLIAGCAGGGETMLEFRISLAKTEFRVGEEILLTMTLRNPSRESMVVNGRLAVNDSDAPPPFRDVYLRIETPSGEGALFGWDVRIGFPDREDFLRLAPGESLAATVDLAFLYPLDQKGEYRITAVYENTLPGPKDFDAATGEFVEEDIGAAVVKLESNTLTFEIK